jgi:ribosomal protein S18 acetylase RimI-like enzyme
VIPLLADGGIRHNLLEVIDDNFAAKKVYDEVGFHTIRTLVAFKSTGPVVGSPAADIRNIDEFPTGSDFLSVSPSWQNATAAVNRDRDSHILIGAFRNGELVGCAAYVEATGRIRQVAVHRAFRRQKIGTTLIRHLFQNSGTGSLVITNVEEEYEPAMQFFKALQFTPFLRLYEMKMEIK